ncbi:methylesterase 8-like [Arachis ipaensis]|uniref:methylesterase 8-like n=1 Tax=Arachis ipaensis TaxID=130454 RepID=UPI0007AF21A2|nr:methylesterase 8-like [Arachis ipaensis]
MEQVKKQHPQTRVFILLLIILLSLTSKSSGSSSSESSKNTKHHFVLVHGSCHGAWSWYKVITLLKSRGHNVTALDLAASGVNQKKASELKSISEYFEPLTKFMASLVDEGQRVVLVGHSFGGFAISYAMEHFPHKISVAVFITAFMPSPLNVSTVYQMDWNLAITLMRPFRLFSNEDVTKVLTLSHAKYGSVSRVYVVSEKDVLITPNLQRRIIKDNPPNRVVEIAGSDHMVMMSKPKDLYLQLQSIAANYD